MSTIVQEIDYSNFKNEVGLSSGHARAKCYNKVWSAMYDTHQDSLESYVADFEGLPWSPPVRPRAKRWPMAGW